jgi:hypothetical protein
LQTPGWLISAILAEFNHPATESVTQSARDNKSLLTVARSRGINVTAEANLKPGVADNRIITKIIDDFSDDELDDARDIGLEASRNPALKGNMSPEALRVQLLQTFFPEAKIPQASVARYQKQLQTRIPLSTLLEAGQ